MAYRALAGATTFSRLRADLLMAVREQTTLEPYPGDPSYLSQLLALGVL